MLQLVIVELMLCDYTEYMCSIVDICGSACLSLHQLVFSQHCKWLNDRLLCLV